MGSSRVIDHDTLRTRHENVPRFVVSVVLPHAFVDEPLEIGTLRDPDVRVLAIHPIPGRSEWLAIVSFVGIPAEGGYEVQMPVLLGTGGAVRRIEWKRWKS
jgi:hypothetical protein